MDKLHPQQIKDFADDLSQVGRRHEQILSHPTNKDLADALTKLRKDAEAKYDRVAEH